MRLKQGVDIRGIKPELILAMVLVEPVISKHAKFVVTSVCDGTHMKTSLHYQGLAMDVRTREIPEVMLRPCLEEIKSVLGSQFDVVLEGDHYHIEFDPKEK